MSFYRTILKQAWAITWRIKYLWFFGLFAFLALVGNGGELQLILRMFSFDFSKPLLPWLNNLTSTGLLSKQGLLHAGGLLTKDPLTVITLLFTWLLILALAIFIIWLVVISLGALINNTALVLGNKKSSFEEGVKIGMQKFWKIFSYNLILKILMFILFVPFVFIAIKPEFIFSNILYIVLFVLFVPLAMAIAFIIRYAMAYIVIKNKGFKEALISGWQLFVKNWIVTLEFAIILFFINIGVLISYNILILFFTTPYQKLLIIAANISFTAFWTVLNVAPVAMYLFAAMMGAVFAVFQITSWTNLFIMLEGKGGTSKITRIFSRN